tara:strand:+ start:8 stop:136 length:129 start_codon:yes stop_codon:yes gene_type:complete
MEVATYDVYVKGIKITVRARDRFKALRRAKIKYCINRIKENL